MDNALDFQFRGRRSIPRFSGLTYETSNPGPVSVLPMSWWDLKFELIHSHYYFMFKKAVSELELNFAAPFYFTMYFTRLAH